MDAATLICARLLRAGAVPRAELPDLDFPEVRRDVERRLQAGFNFPPMPIPLYLSPGIPLSPA